MCTNEFKSTKAITLIALVISILVLLILAGVSVSLVVGETGITGRAITAKKTYDIAGAKEQVELLVEGYIGDYYGKKYTSGESVSQDIGTYVATQLASDTTVGDYTLETSGANVALKKGEEIVARGKINSSGGLEWSNGTETKVALIKVSDSSSAKDATVGEEVAIGDEHFFVIKADDRTLTLLAKYNLAATINENNKYVQEDGVTCVLSNEDYWSEKWESTIRLNLNTYEETYSTEMPNTETEANNAILKARKYGRDLGVIGRLMTAEEVEGFGGSLENCSTEACPDFINTQNFWLSSVYDYSSNCIWAVYGQGNCWSDDWFGIDSGVGVRPVLEVSKDKIE